ncbi:MAG: acyl-CoA thioesterase [Luteitalea sp.]|nr:acyl-CoA thioesterase [Luteitalea sp.]
MMKQGALVLSEHRHRRRVQFYETDLAGIVHFSWYFRYMEEAEHALWRTAGLSVAPRGSEIGWARVSATCDFQRPLRFEEEFEVWIRVAAVTRKTIKYVCEVTRGDTKIAEGSMTVICVRMRPGEAIEAIDIPSEITARLRVSQPAGGTA